MQRNSRLNFPSQGIFKGPCMIIFRYFHHVCSVSYWVRIRVFRCSKWPLCQLCHNNCYFHIDLNLKLPQQNVVTKLIRSSPNCYSRVWHNFVKNNFNKSGKIDKILDYQLSTTKPSWQWGSGNGTVSRAVAVYTRGLLLK